MKDLPPSAAGRIVALGNFDGVHRGHRALMAEARRQGDAMGLPVCVWSFEALPDPCLTPPALRASLLASCGADEVVYDDFFRVRTLSPEAFFRDVLLGSLGAKACVCGFNYTFGHKGAGNADTLVRLCKEAGIPCFVVPAVSFDGIAVSSTRIRALLKEGAVEEASALLGYPPLLQGKVEGGRKFGREMGIPTINQRFDETVCLPKRGVYATFCRVEGRIFPSVTNVGCCPTVTDGRDTVVETHLLDFDGALYGKTVTVGLLRYLREEKTFPSVETLREAILRDANTARAIFGQSYPNS
ncbi:MAG: riboflavin biosynthesis protein RibF [Clostridia bacterium]|nr:riboflavin biosynthesis protein RibF [Clostridia bacterium]